MHSIGAIHAKLRGKTSRRMRLESDACVWSQSGFIPDETLGFPLQGTAAKPSLAHWVAKGGARPASTWTLVRDSVRDPWTRARIIPPITSDPNHKIVPATGLGASPKGPSVAGGGASVIGGPGCRVSVGGVYALVEGAVSADFPPQQHSTMAASSEQPAPHRYGRCSVPL